MPTSEAIRIAREQSLDLVEVAPLAVPPVCRLLDFGRFKYEQTKKEREAKRGQKLTLLKQVRLTPKTDDHDIEVKVKSIERFLEEGDKVKVEIRFKGRELAHPQIGRLVLDTIVKHLQNHAVVERPPLMEGKSMFLILAAARAVAVSPVTQLPTVAATAQPEPQAVAR